MRGQELWLQQAHHRRAKRERFPGHPRTVVQPPDAPCVRGFLSDEPERDQEQWLLPPGILPGVEVRQDRTMTMPARLSVVTLGARDLPRLRRFYSALGWQEVAGSDDDWAGYLVGGVLLALYPVEALAREAAPDASLPSGATAGDPASTGWSGVTLACNVDSPADVDTAFAAAIDAGATAIADPVTREWGGRSGYIADPEGTRWEIAWAGSARFDERGSLIGFGY
jgi:catechol 2,3-dioxygenase-like lactoylglutathione lyase family enzyme